MSSSEELTPDKVLEILKKHGKVVSLEMAAEIADFINLLAEITVKNYLDKQNIRKNKV